MTHWVILVNIMIRRFIFKKLQKELPEVEINILLGPRQVGKTTLLKQMQAHVKRKGIKSHFFDLEQPQILAEFNNPESEIIGILKKAAAKSGNKVDDQLVEALEKALLEG